MDTSLSPRDRVRAALKAFGLPSELTEFDASTRTAQDAANAIGCELGQIVKTLFFLADGRPTMTLVAGDRQADTGLVAQLIGVGRKKLKMGSPEQVLQYTGYSLGGVSPVGALTPCDVVIDDSLQRFETIWAAAGNGHTVFPISTDDLIRATQGQLATITKAPE